MDKRKCIDWDKLPLLLNLTEWSSAMGVNHSSLRHWRRVGELMPYHTENRAKGRPKVLYHKYDVRQVFYEKSLVHGWLGYKRCRCGAVHKRKSSLCTTCGRARDRLFRELNPEKRRAYVRATKAKRPDHYRLKARQARSKRRAIERTGSAGRDIVLPDWTPRGKCCYWCGDDISNDWHFDHVVPLKEGGRHESYNIVVSCPSCNLQKGAKHPNEFTKNQMELVYE